MIYEKQSFKVGEGEKERHLVEDVLLHVVFVVCEWDAQVERAARGGGGDLPARFQSHRVNRESGSLWLLLLLLCAAITVFYDLSGLLNLCRIKLQNK